MKTLAINAIVALVSLYLGNKVGKIQAYRKAVKTIDILIDYIRSIGGSTIPTFEEYQANKTYWNNIMDGKVGK